MKKIHSLQNGSDIRGVALTTEKSQANMTEVETYQIAKGIVHWLTEKKTSSRGQTSDTLKVAIGHDSRLSAENLKEGLIKGLVERGVQVIDVGLATTPAMFMTTQFPEFNCDCGIMITASHLPYYFNGLKLFTKDGGAEKEDIHFILNCEEEPDKHIISDSGTVERKDVIPLYAKDLVNKIRAGIRGNKPKPLEGFHIVVDAGNGSGGFFVPHILEELGADTSGSQFLDPDGHFPNHIPNPDNQEAMTSIQAAVIKNQADLGVIFDTDVDRAAVVDQKGEVINRNNLIAVLATIVLGKYPGTAIVTNSPTSSHLKEFIETLGGKQIRYLCGYRNVINKAIDLNQQGTQTELAIETSGHAAFKENYFLDDGAYVIAKILMLLPSLKEEGKSLSSLIAKLQQPAEAQEVRFEIQADRVKNYGDEVIHKLERFVKAEMNMSIDQDNHEGIRVNVTGEYGTGWFLLRMSLHEPLLVLQVENDQARKNEILLTKLAVFFAEWTKLDQTKLQKIMENFDKG